MGTKAVPTATPIHEHICTLVSSTRSGSLWLCKRIKWEREGSGFLERSLRVMVMVSQSVSQFSRSVVVVASAKRWLMGKCNSCCHLPPRSPPRHDALAAMVGKTQELSWE